MLFFHHKEHKGFTQRTQGIIVYFVFPLVFFVVKKSTLP